MPAKDFVSITRPVNCLMAAFGTFIGYSIASGMIQFQRGIFIAMLVAFLVCAGGMAVNDYFDRFVDKRLHPGKPLPSGRMTGKAAMLYASALFLAGNLLAFFYLPGTAFAIAFAFTILLTAYSRFLSKAKYLGNLVVASGTAFTLVFGASLIGNYSVVAFLAIAALFANLARELVKDLQDLEADRGSKLSLPMLLGGKTVLVLIFIYYIIAIASVYAPAALFSFTKPFFLAVVSIANLGFLYSFGLAAKGNFAKAQTLSKAAMFLALIGFLLGVL